MPIKVNSIDTAKEQGNWYGQMMGTQREFLQGPVAKAIFGPLAGIADSLNATFAPETVKANEIKFGDYEDKATTQNLQRMAEFYNHLNGPLDMGDPQVRQIVNRAQSSALRQASNQGIRGGLSTANTEANVGTGLADLAAKRSEQVGQFMPQLANLQMQAFNNQYGRYNSAFQAEQAATEAMRSGIEQKNGGVVGMVGGVIGGLLGGGAGAKVGYGAGQAIGGPGSVNAQTYQQPGLSGGF